MYGFKLDLAFSMYTLMFVCPFCTSIELKWFSIFLFLFWAGFIKVPLRNQGLKFFNFYLIFFSKHNFFLH